MLASNSGQNPYQIATNLGCNPQTVRNAIHKFNAEGLSEALRRGSNRPHTVHRAFDPEGTEVLREMLHQSPRKFGKDSSLWTLAMAAQVSFEEGLTADRVSGETIRATLFGADGGALAKSEALDHLSRPPVCEKKRRRDRLMELAAINEDWVAGFCDECWWSRVAQPNLHSFSEEGEPLRLVEQSVAKNDPDPKAISCYGLYVPELEEMWLRVLWTVAR